MSFVERIGYDFEIRQTSWWKAERWVSAWPDIFSDLRRPARRVLAGPYMASMHLIQSSDAPRAAGCAAIAESYREWVLGYSWRGASGRKAALERNDCESLAERVIDVSPIRDKQ